MQTDSMKPALPDYDFEVRSADIVEIAKEKRESSISYLKYLVPGILFGIVIVKSEVISWFRIQEMFRLKSFHMYGVMGTAVITGILSVWLIKKFNMRSITGERIVFPVRKFNKGQIYGGLLFGCGWAITGACPGPLFALIGAGFPVIIVTLLSAIAGTWVYGLVRQRLPH
jgi:uncharacterized membrane protein YedE/YeeE